MSRKLVFSLRDQLVELIQERIITNQYLPGQEIQIDKLAAEFGVSTTPVREALARLEGAGLVKMIANRGYYVGQISQDDVRDVWEMRRLMEPYAAETAAIKCTDDEISGVTLKLQWVAEHPDDFKAYMSSDFELHDLLFRHVPNRLFHETLERIRKHSARIRYFAESGSPHGRTDVVRRVTQEHIAIAQALASRNPKETARLVMEHLINAENRTLHAIEQRNKSIQQ